MKRVLVTGAGGFIGHHLVKYLLKKGYWVRGVDIKEPEYEESPAHEFKLLDLREKVNALEAAKDGIEEVYDLAADMGGIGFITSNYAAITRNNTLINLYMLEASRQKKVQRYLFSSSACVYPMYKQKEPDILPLKEEDVWPANPEPGYGLEKLFTEELCRYYYQDYGLETRIVRLHNVYGPLGTFDGGREKAPAAICRKVALAENGSKIEVWGDGKQTRSFLYIDDCVEGMYRIMHSDYRDPLNLGMDKMITINELVDLVARIAGKTLKRRHNANKPQGVRGRNSDNSLLQKTLRWEPQISLEEGLTYTYQWISSELERKAKVESDKGTPLKI